VSLVRDTGATRPSVAPPPDGAAHSFAVKTSLVSSAAIFVFLHLAWDSDFWPLFFAPGYLFATYLVGRFAGAERAAKRDARIASALQAGEDVCVARDAARRAETSAGDSEAVASDAVHLAGDRPVAANAARKAAAGATSTRNAARRAAAFAQSAEENARKARDAKSVEQAESAARQTADDRREAVAAAEEAATHNMAAHAALEDARTAIAQEGASHEDLMRPLARAVEFRGFLRSAGVESSRRDAICQNVARELLSVAIALRDPDTRRLAASDGSIQGLLSTIDARLAAQDLDLPEARLIFSALGYGQSKGPGSPGAPQAGPDDTRDLN